MNKYPILNPKKEYISMYGSSQKNRIKTEYIQQRVQTRVFKSKRASCYYNPKIRLFAILLKNLSQRQLKKSFQGIFCHSKRYQRKISSLRLIASKYQRCRLLDLKLSWQRIVSVGEGYKFAQRKFKNTLILMTRLQHTIKAKAFRKIFQQSRRNNKAQNRKVQGNLDFRDKKLPVSSFPDKIVNKLKKAKSLQYHKHANIQGIKGSLFIRKLQALYIRKLSQHFDDVVGYSYHNKDLQKQDKLRIFSIIIQKLLKNTLFSGFNYIYSYGFVNQIRSGSSLKQREKNNQKIRLNKNSRKSEQRVYIKGQSSLLVIPPLLLNQVDKQIDCPKLHQMTMQLQNKNLSIEKLTQEIRSIKMQILARNNFSLVQNQGRNHRDEIKQDRSYAYLIPRAENSLDYYNLNNGQNSSSIPNLVTYRNNRYQQSNSRQKQLKNIKKDLSFNSLLNTSFLSFKSKDSRLSASRSKNKGNSVLGGMIKSNYHGIPNLDCTCIFRHKSKQYKTLNESIKNQLQIMKKELEVAKDLNEHFQNELKMYGGRPQEDQQEEMQKLALSIKQINKENDQLKEKVIKYQKHVATMKGQFKRKMQEIYRRVKKDI